MFTQYARRCEMKKCFDKNKSLTKARELTSKQEHVTPNKTAMTGRVEARTDEEDKSHSKKSLSASSRKIFQFYCFNWWVVLLVFKNLSSGWF